jgi:hypothetical protein
MLTIALILASALSPSAEARTIGGDFDPAPFCFQSPYDPTSPEADQLCCINVFHPDICPDVLEDAFELALDPHASTRDVALFGALAGSAAGDSAAKVSIAFPWDYAAYSTCVLAGTAGYVAGGGDATTGAIESQTVCHDLYL